MINKVKKLLFLILRISISAGILLYVLNQPDVKSGHLLSAIANINKLWLLSGVLIFFSVLLLGTLRWKILLESHGLYVSYIKVLEYNFIGNVFNNVMPSLTGGDVIKAFYIARDASKKAEAISTIVMDRFLGLFALLILAVMGALSCIGDPRLLLPSLTILGMFVIIVLGIVVFHSRTIMSRLNVFRYFGIKLKIEDKIKKIYDVFVYYRRDPVSLAKALGLSLVLQMLLIMMNYSIAKGLGLKDIGIGQFFLLIPVAGIISALPISFAGWGVGEGAYKWLFSLAGTGQGGIAVGLSIIVRLIMLGWSLVGLPVYLLHKPEKIETIE